MEYIVICFNETSVLVGIDFSLFQSEVEFCGYCGLIFNLVLTWE